MDAPFRIRTAQPADVERLAELERTCFPDPWTRDGLLELVQASQAIARVVEADGPVVGYVLARWVADSAEILNLAVAPEARRLGLARQMLDDVLAALASRGVREVYLEVRQSNAPARRLYETRGFRVAGMRRAYYRHPIEDALVLRLAVPGFA
jgi:[ribosomal protein S18]-alanine N-acetyltransferase